MEKVNDPECTRCGATMENAVRGLDYVVFEIEGFRGSLCPTCHDVFRDFLANKKGN